MFFKERVSIAILLDFSGNGVKIKIQFFVLVVFISSSRHRGVDSARVVMKMIFKITYLLAIVVAVFSYSHVAAEDLQTHSIYKVTSYNLGAILDDQGSSKSSFSRNFSPLLITSTTADILNSEHEGTVSWVETDPHTSNTRGIAIAGQFNATGKIALQGAFGLTKNLWSPDSINYGNESSWEANLGVIYKLMNNLSFELHFAYMETGDLYTRRSSYSDVESIIMVSNRLTMSF